MQQHEDEYIEKTNSLIHEAISVASNGQAASERVWCQTEGPVGFGHD